jgi:hypothetical protein
VSALAVETAENLPDVPDVSEAAFSELPDESGGAAAEIESDPTVGNTGEPDVPAEQDKAKQDKAKQDKAEQDKAKQDKAEQHKAGQETDQSEAEAKAEQAIDNESDDRGADGTSNETATDAPAYARTSNS